LQFIGNPWQLKSRRRRRHAQNKKTTLVSDFKRSRGAN
jgi:hypothetical protein